MEDFKPLTNASFLLAMQYNFDMGHFPNPYRLTYRCTGHECPWSQYNNGTDFGFYEEGGGHIKDCGSCMAKCDEDPSCGSVECGPDQPLPDGTVLEGYCSWWRTGKCETAAEFSTNPNNYILTCKKQCK